MAEQNPANLPLPATSDEVVSHSSLQNPIQNFLENLQNPQSLASTMFQDYLAALAIQPPCTTPQVHSPATTNLQFRGSPESPPQLQQQGSHSSSSKAAAAVASRQQQPHQQALPAPSLPPPRARAPHHAPQALPVAPQVLHFAPHAPLLHQKAAQVGCSLPGGNFAPTTTPPFFSGAGDIFPAPWTAGSHVPSPPSFFSHLRSPMPTTGVTSSLPPPPSFMANPSTPHGLPMQSASGGNAFNLITLNGTSLCPIKLDEHNFQKWKAYWQPSLIGYGLEAFVTASPSYENLCDLNWVRQDQLLKVALLSTLSPLVVDNVIEAHTSFEIWQTLVNQYARPTRSHILTLKRSMSSASKGTLSMSAYIQSLRNIVVELSDAGERVTDDDFTLSVLEGLPDVYRGIADSIHTRGTSLTYPELYRTLVDYEVSLQRRKSVSDSPSFSVNTAYRGGFSKGGRSSNRRGSHAQSGSSGKNVTRPESSSDKRVQQSRAVICQVCQKSGHQAKTCHRLQDMIAKLFTDGSSSHPQVNFAGQDGSQASWLVDSGASHHVTSDLQNLTLHQEYDGSDDVVLGDGHSYGSSAGNGYT